MVQQGSAGGENREGQMGQAEMCQLRLYPIVGSQYGSVSRAGPAASPLDQCFTLGSGTKGGREARERFYLGSLKRGSGGRGNGELWKRSWS